MSESEIEVEASSGGILVARVKNMVEVETALGESYSTAYTWGDNGISPIECLNQAREKIEKMIGMQGSVVLQKDSCWDAERMLAEIREFQRELNLEGSFNDYWLEMEFVMSRRLFDTLKAQHECANDAGEQMHGLFGLRVIVCDTEEQAKHEWRTLSLLGRKVTLVVEEASE